MAQAVVIDGVTIGYDGKAILSGVDFAVAEGEILAIMGGSGCGKSTLLKHIIGLYYPMAGDIRIFDRSIVTADAAEKRDIRRGFGVAYQGGALFGWMTVGDNVALPLREYTDKSEREIAEIVAAKLKLVDLDGCAGRMPSELSGGMVKRAAAARALALDPRLLFFDEPSAGLDPITSSELDRLILRLRDDCGATIVLVTHELDSVFTVADRVVMLDRATRSVAAAGAPLELRDHCEIGWVRDFLNRNGLHRRKED